MAARAGGAKRADRARRARAQRSGASRARSRWIAWLAGGLSLAVVITIAIVAAGYDARETPREEPSVWAMRSSGQYARVNTLTGEIDTVRTVEDPSGLLQAGAAGVVLSHGNGRAWNIDPQLPLDLTEGGDGAQEDGAEADGSAAQTAGSGEGDGASTAVAMRTPDGTRDTVIAGDTVLFRNEEGEVFLSTFETPADGGAAELSEPLPIDPFADEETEEGEEPRRFHADAAALDADGRAVLFSATEHAIRTYDAASGEFRGGAEPAPEAAPAKGVQIAIVAGKWVLFDAEGGRLWREGSDDAIPLKSQGTARLQSSSTEEAGEDVLVADEGGLWRVSGGKAARVERASGVPAQPVAVGADRFTGWIGSESAQLWSSKEGLTPLDLDPAAKIPGDPEPVIRSNGSRALLTEVKTGMMWTVPDGRLIPVEQWSLVDPPKQETGTVVVNDVTEQVPPVAVDDAFGLRAGESAPLPVMLNDYDPNRKDVLTIVAEGLGEGLPPEFGAVSLISDAQQLVIQTPPSASGTASFTYRITDGVNVSEPATVTLTIADPSANSAPQWCPVDGCQRPWPSPELAPGGTLVLPILEGWVDPEGDPMMLQSAVLVNPEDPLRALITADGRLALRHTDPNAPDGDIAVRVGVADMHGAVTERELRVQIRSGAKAELEAMASTIQVGQPSAVSPLKRIIGGSGSYALVDAVVQSGTATATPNLGTGTVEVSAKEAGESIIALTARDTGTEAEITGVLRVTAVVAQPKLGLPPLRAFVRPLADTTVDILQAIPGANSRALVVRAASVADGELRADVIEHAQVRVSGSTPDGAPGRIGAVDVTVAEGGDVATGRLTVFQVPDSGTAGAIAVADSITVRAGAVADIPVLENDVAPPGQRLVLHPEISGSGQKGELAFASGNVLRYLAPDTPGDYTLSYTTYSASSPEASDVGHVRVTVLPKEGNRDPQPRAITVRLAPGERVSASVQLSGVDPDGDRVRLVGVAASDDPQLTATLAPRSSAIQVEASKKATPGTKTLSYTVRDAGGSEASGRLRVIVTEADPNGGAPITYSDYVRLAQGAKDAAVVQPLDNDIDPANGELELVEVVPNVPGGKDSEQYRDLASRLDVSQLKQGRIAVRGGDEPGTASYRYTVRSSESSSTADGLIVVQVSTRVGQQAPTVKDTVLSARDRAELERGGVDVVTDRVYWAAGDVRTLKLSVWGGAADRFSVNGTKISGKYRAEGDLVPFSLTGTDLTGAEVRTFGFLVIPPLDELRLTLKPGLSPIRVEENKSVDVALADVVDLAQGDTAELKRGGLPVQRAQAACEATSSSSIRYTAGKEAPWTDNCVISVKLTEQKAWTQLAVPIEIVPNEPVVELETLTRTVAPGASETINLLDMVRWQGGREGQTGKLAFQVSGGGGSFELNPSGSQLTVTARADAVPGGQDALVVSVSGAGESQAPLTLRVGEAAKDAPRGATVNLNCTVGSGCQARVIGAPGEYDPFAGKSGGGLKLDSVDGAGCAYGTLQAAGDSVSVSWPNGSRGPGGQCTATFTVRDAQNRVGTGSIELDAQGVPRAPTSISTVGYSASSVTLEVQLNATAAHPGVSGVRIMQDGGGANANCSGGGTSYRCEVGGLAIGQKHSYTAVAVNAVGESDPTPNAVQAWAYARPEAPTVSAQQVSAESSDTGTVKLQINGAHGTRGYRVITAAGETQASGRNTSVNVSGLPVGNADYQVIPLTEFEPPTGDSAEGAGATGSVAVSGLPVVSIAPGESAQGSNKATVIVTVDPRGEPDSVRYGVSTWGGCAATQNAGGGTSFTEEVTGTPYEPLTVTACARNKWGQSPATASTTVNVGGTPAPPTVNSGWTIRTAPAISGSSAKYDYQSGPSVSASPGLQLDYLVNGSSVGPSFPGTVDPGSTYTVRQCKSGNCSDAVAINGNVPGPVTVDLSGCLAATATPGEMQQRITPHAAASATPSYDAANQKLTVLWGGAYGPLQSLEATVAKCP